MASRKQKREKSTTDARVDQETLSMITAREYDDYIRDNPIPVNVELMLFSCFSVYNKQEKIVPNKKECRMTVEDGDVRREYHAVIEGPVEYGLPTSTDQDFYIGIKAMVQYRFKKYGQIDNPVRFSKQELCRFTGHAYGSGLLYDQIERWLEVFSKLTITATEHYKKPGFEKETKQIFRIFDTFKSVRINKDDKSARFDVKLSDWFLAQMTSEYTIPIDASRYFRISTPIAKVLVPILYALVHFADDDGYLFRDYSELCSCMMMSDRGSACRRKTQFQQPIRDLVTNGGYLDKCHVDNVGVHFWYSKWMREKRDTRRRQQNASDIELLKGVLTPSDLEDRAPKSESPDDTRLADADADEDDDSEEDGHIPMASPSIRSPYRTQWARPTPPLPTMRYPTPHSSPMKFTVLGDKKKFEMSISTMVAVFEISDPSRYKCEYSIFHLVQLLRPFEVSLGRKGIGVVIGAALKDRAILDNIVIHQDIIGKLSGEINFNTIDHYLSYLVKVTDEALQKMSGDERANRRAKIKEQYEALLGGIFQEVGDTLVDGAMRGSVRGNEKSLLEWVKGTL